MARYYDNANQAQRFQPGTTVRADEVDAKFDQVSSAFSDVENEVDRSLKLVDDGSNHEVSATATQRRNKVVGFDATGTMALLDGFTFRGDFAANTDYFVNDVIRDTTTKNLFVVDERHTSSSTRDDSKMSLAIDVDDVETAKVAAQTAQSAAESAQSSAEDAQGYAEQWANRPEDSLITGAAGGDGVDDFSALHHANKAAGSASAAATSETNASASESAAAASESAAASSESNASTSETNAANSATNASNSASAASASESAAATSESNAATSESNAATSESNAATSESNAASSATAAANSASAASTSETNAAASESAAATSETNAAASETNAAASFDDFDDRYLGPKSSAPSTDNDGDPLQLGTLYFDTSTNTMQVFSASGFIPAGSSVNGTSNRFEYTATNGQTTFSGADDKNNSLQYDSGFLDVYLNGVRLINGTDFTATSGTSIQLTSSANAGDVLSIVAFGTFTLSNQSLNDMTDASTSNVSDGDLLVYSNANGHFEPSKSVNITGGTITNVIIDLGAVT